MVRTMLHTGLGMSHTTKGPPGTGLASYWNHKKERRSNTMGGKTEELKGRVKEAAGALTGDRKLKREGRDDQAVGKIKQKVEKVIDRVKGALS